MLVQSAQLAKQDAANPKAPTGPAPVAAASDQGDNAFLLDIVEVAQATGADAEDVAALYFILSERYEVDRMLTRITGLPRDDRWSALARAALRSDLYSALTGMTRRVLETTRGISEPLERIEAWESQQAEGLARARAALDEIGALEDFDLATLSVALRTIRTLVAQGA